MRYISIVLFFLLSSFNLLSQSDAKAFQEIDGLIKQKNFFQAENFMPKTNHDFKISINFILMQFLGMHLIR